MFFNIFFSSQNINQRIQDIHDNDNDNNRNNNNYNKIIVFFNVFLFFFYVIKNKDEKRADKNDVLIALIM